MKLIDVTVPLDASLPIYPGNTTFTPGAARRIDEAPGADGAPARVLLRRN